jgi:hypothetical protein
MASKKARKRSGRPQRQISVRAVRRDSPDLKKLSQALIALAVAQAEADARAEHERTEQQSDGGTERRSA